MTFKEFTNTVLKQVQERVAGSETVSLHPVLKNNGIAYQGLIIEDPIMNIHPTIYMDPYYHKYLDGESVEEILDDIMDTYYKNKPTEDFNVSTFKDFSKVKDKIIMKLVNAEMNKELLQQIPHKLMGDFAVTYHVVVEEFIAEYATILIYNEHLEYWGISVEELHDIAMENTPRLLPYRLDNLGTIFEDAKIEMGISDIDFKMHILTNKLKIHGATAILYPNLLKKIYDFLEDNIIILPSSTHEVIIMTEHDARNEGTVESLNEIIKYVNDTELSDTDILGNKAYIFNGNELAVFE